MMNGMCGIDCAALSGLKLVLWRYSQGVALGCIMHAFQASSAAPFQMCVRTSEDERTQKEHYE